MYEKPCFNGRSNHGLKKTDAPKKVLIAGGGIAGIEAADALVKCGHTPVVYETADHLGGQFAIAGVAPRKGDFKYGCDMAIKNIEEQGVEVHLNTTVDADLIAKEAPDAVIVAIGSTPATIPVEGIEKADVISSHDVLSGKEITAKTAIVIGGGLVGMETAEYLAAKGVTVTVVEMRDAILKELGTLRKIGTQFALAQEPITVLTETTCKALDKGKVVVEGKDGEQTLEADAIIMAVGSKARDTESLTKQCEAMNIPCYVVGDANAPRLALNAIHEAYKAVLDINK